ncbi:Cytokine receptor-like factor 3 [Varanus komodoensis]|uniref:cytokine receptor-like factor 3 n=1 Tax=Varanus komodoensis TaxID=61221 RepID=UPI001CF7D0ED|nr:cytokine receptor-like factor 3 [Varanus komodoensis]KAF7246972.1 Cytokine receptor-like factor 3 [Varanus komodoensis]
MDLETEAMLQEARESIEAARTYRRELQQRLKGLHLARQQIKDSAALTRDVLEQHFSDLKGTLKKLLDERLVTLLQEVDAIEQQSIKPLDECQKLIEHGVGTADELVREGESAIHGVTWEDSDKLCSFTKKALHIQLDSLPEVPSLVDVPSLSAQLDDSLLAIVKNQIFNHGTVASQPPVQIEELVEKPGGILVRWCKVDEDFIPQDYRLQCRKSTASHFEDVYVGSDTEFTVLHIDPNVDYQFRVCARGDGRQEWSPWSVPQIGCSTLVPHEWTPGLEGYSLSSRRNIALRNDSQAAGVLYSKAPTYYCGQTLTFRIEAIGQPARKDSIGVCVEKQNGCDSLQRDKAVCVSTNGVVFVNGKEMTNQLPAFTSGSSVTFDMEAVNLGPSNNNEGGNLKLRVTISSNNREVVFDWVLDQCCESLYFGCSFPNPGWKVLVF